jgi:tryptophan aminotransferase
MMATVLFRQWRLEGFLKHTEDVSSFYRHRRDTFIKHANKHLTGLAEWKVPSAGKRA